MNSIKLVHALAVLGITLLFGLTAFSRQQPAGGDVGECQLCHQEDSWTELRSPLLFDHAGTAFPLTGSHRQVDCRSCHTGSSYEEVHQFTKAPTNCSGCHEDIHSGELGNQCTDCHTTERWIDPISSRQMHEGTRLPLVGVHAGLDCQACHAAGTYAGLSPECVSCHLEDFRRTRNPDHTATGFDTECQRCHGLVTSTWNDNTIGYNLEHPFPLIGGHDNLECAACHLPGSEFSSLSAQCVSCHENQYIATTDPNHVEAGFGTQCDVCHTVFRWSDAHFDHNATGFPLTGSHALLECTACHAEGYTGLTGDCSSCHLAEFEAAIEPPHEGESFGLDCAICHSTTAWTPATFDHAVITGYELSGAHATVTCDECHVNGQYVNTPVSCVGCHSDDFDSAEIPPHESATFGTDCLDCHNTSAWSPATFDHAQVTGYQLTGAHTSIACVDCHVGGQYADTPNQCFGCHSSEFENATEPPHDPASFGTDCLDCHTTTAWAPANFDHLTVTGYPLTGAHTSVACTECHPGGQYTSTPTTCYGCHQQEYESTTDPNHVAAGFPTSCEECHTTSTWDDATFDHDGQWFPIYSGSHRGTWDSCSDCHPNASAYSDFTCISCHEHNQAEMNSEHDDVANYRYESSACYECHPQGRADDDDSLIRPLPKKVRRM